MKPYERQRSIFARMDAGPWTCPNCRMPQPWYTRPDNLERIANDRGGLVGYGGEGDDEVLKCFTCWRSYTWGEMKARKANA